MGRHPKADAYVSLAGEIEALLRAATDLDSLDKLKVVCQCVGQMAATIGTVSGIPEDDMTVLVSEYFSLGWHLREDQLRAKAGAH